MAACARVNGKNGEMDAVPQAVASHRGFGDGQQSWEMAREHQFLGLSEVILGAAWSARKTL
jgi:hypothetical protein